MDLTLLSLSIRVFESEFQQLEFSLSLIAFTMTGHLRPTLYTHRTPPSPFDYL